MRYRILGPIEAWNGKQWVAPGPPKQKSLLVALLLHPNRVLTRAQLAQNLWGATAPRGAAGDLLSGHVAKLRRLLGDHPGEVLVTREDGYQLVVPAGGLDTHRAQHLLAEGRQLMADDPDRAARLLREALDLWRGRSLADAPDHPVTAAAAGKLDDLRGVTAESWIEAELRLGHHGRLLATLRAMSYRFAHRERLRAQLMVALWRSGRQAEALTAYEDLRRALAAGPRIEPSPPLRRLYEQIRADPGPESSVAVLHTDEPVAGRTGSDVLSEQDAVALLGQVGGPDRITSEPGAAVSIVRRCGLLPLAIRIVGAQLAARPQLPVHTLAGNLVEQCRLLQAAGEDLDPVRAGVLLAYRMLRGSADCVDTDAARALRVIAAEDTTEVSVPDLVKRIDRSEPAARTALDRLVAVHLLHSPAPGEYVMHRLVRAAAAQDG